jgi:hypothetical protein
MVKNEQKTENVNGIGIVGSNISGGGINDSEVFIELTSLLKKKDEQIDRLLSIIESFK